MTTEQILLKYKPNKDNLLNILHEVQDNSSQNFISKEDILKICKYLNITQSHIYGVIGYYSMLSSEPRGKHLIRVCKSPICQMHKSINILNFLLEYLEIGINQTSKDGLFTVEKTECLGCCDKAPALMIDKKLCTSMTIDSVKSIIEKLKNNQ